MRTEFELDGQGSNGSALNVIASLKRARLTSGERLCDLSMVNPDLEPPRALIDKFLEFSMKPGAHRYSLSRGIRRFRDGVVSRYQNLSGLKLDPEKNICGTLGTKDAIEQALFCLRRRSEQIFLPVPTYPAHSAAAKLAGFKVGYFRVGADQSKMLSEIADQLEKNPGSVLLLNFPSNPGGQAVNAEFYTELAAIARRSDAFLLNDFVYGDMSFDANLEIPSLLSVREKWENCAETYSLSKAYSVPGWRSGALLGEEKLINWVARRKSLTDYGAFLPTQRAAAFALENGSGFVRQIVRVYRSRKELFAEGLSEQGWDISDPAAGCCIWARIPEHSAFRDSLDFARELINTHGIAVLPGMAFGQEFSNYIRFSLVVSDEQLRDVLASLAEFTGVADSSQERVH